jgi:hypothetical protein
MEDVQVAAAAYYFISAPHMCLSGARCVVGSLVFPRVGTRASFDAEQKNRHPTHGRSHSARMPNIRHARARTLSAHPDSRSAENVRRCVEVALRQLNWPHKIVSCNNALSTDDGERPCSLRTFIISFIYPYMQEGPVVTGFMSRPSRPT